MISILSHPKKSKMEKLHWRLQVINVSNGCCSSSSLLHGNLSSCCLPVAGGICDCCAPSTTDASINSH
uniref:Glycosyltransferase, CAZy family GT8 n=1 Tax=Arundo donax TaxID=35708 RepID=A0A0A9GVG9_ARUDO